MYLRDYETECRHVNTGANNSFYYLIVILSYGVSNVHRH